MPRAGGGPLGGSGDVAAEGGWDPPPAELQSWGEIVSFVRLFPGRVRSQCCSERGRP